MGSVVPDKLGDHGDGSTLLVGTASPSRNHLPRKCGSKEKESWSTHSWGFTKRVQQRGNYIIKENKYKFELYNLCYEKGEGGSRGVRGQV